MTLEEMIQRHIGGLEFQLILKLHEIQALKDENEKLKQQVEELKKCQ